MAESPHAESVTTVLVAGAANLAIAVAKAVGGLITGSSAMLSEAAHSLADTATEVLLFVALKQSGRPADRDHPFGHGRSAYVWALFAAIFTFVAGAGFSITHGFQAIIHGEELGNPLPSYIILAVSFVVESISLARALRQVRGAARHWQISAKRYLRHTADTTVKAVVLEDSAALVGLLTAAAGLALSVATGTAVWDGVASILIGLVLLVVATVLAKANISLLVGRALPARLEAQIHAELIGLPVVVSVPMLYTQQLGIDEVLVAAKVDFVDSATAAEVEQACALAEHRLRETLPIIRMVFLDPTGNHEHPQDAPVPDRSAPPR